MIDALSNWFGLGHTGWSGETQRGSVTITVSFEGVYCYGPCMYRARCHAQEEEEDIFQCHYTGFRQCRIYMNPHPVEEYIEVHLAC